MKKILVVKEVFGVTASFLAGLISLLSGFYTTFGFCGFMFLWSAVSLGIYVYDYLQNESIGSASCDVSEQLAGEILKDKAAVAGFDGIFGVVGNSHKSSPSVINSEFNAFTHLTANTNLSNN